MSNNFNPKKCQKDLTTNRLNNHTNSSEQQIIGKNQNIDLNREINQEVPQEKSKDTSHLEQQHMKGYTLGEDPKGGM